MEPVLGRRALLRAGMGAALATVAGSHALAGPVADSAPSSSRLFLLGTGGGPTFGGERRMACNAITVGNRAYVIDCGYGAVGALVEAGVPLQQVAGIFITHNHADHLLDYGSLLFALWLQGRTEAIQVFGPPPLSSITSNLLAANSVPLDYYRTDMGMPLMPPVEVHEQSVPGLLLDDGTVRVRCAAVVHPPVTPAFGYRFDLPDRSIVFSGDTAPTRNLVALASGADILVHEATMINAVLAMALAAGRARATAGHDGGALPRGYDPELLQAHMLRAHTSAEDAGRIAAQAGVKMLVLSHLGPASSRLVADGEWLANARRHFNGEIIVAHDGVVL
jgi:ribonuclease BN (tRNA processing enzyme)